MIKRGQIYFVDLNPKAKAILKKEHVLMLNSEQSLRLLDALDNPPDPNEALKQLFARHRTAKA